jgi:pyruvate formate lyase activating enzyme
MLKHGVEKMQILPYNPIWLDKLPRFGGVQRLDFGEGTSKFMPDVELDRCIDIFESRGIHVHCHR